jgi:glycosyltransferase involved in cell wall biosynthesis
MKVAIIHEHLAQNGGAERTLRAIAEMFPEAPIYTLLANPENARKMFPGRHIETSIIQKLPGGIKHYQWYMPFMPMAIEFFDLREFDIVISSTSAFAKGVITSIDTLHVSYCHSPTRYIWDYTHQYIGELKYNKYFKKVISLVLNYIRIWDKVAADRVDVYIANSKCVKRRISKYYRRDSTVIYPPVEVEKFRISELLGDYFLIGGRLAPYKRVDLVIETFKLAGDNLIIYGDGVDFNRLKKLAGDAANIKFLGRVDDKTKFDLYSKCLAFINPQEEDFGITTVEAMASGRPVIAYHKGGAAELIKDGETGILFDLQSVNSLKNAIERFKRTEFDPRVLRSDSQKYSTERFKRELAIFIDAELKKFKEID